MTEVSKRCKIYTEDTVGRVLNAPKAAEKLRNIRTLSSIVSSPSSCPRGTSQCDFIWKQDRSRLSVPGGDTVSDVNNRGDEADSFLRVHLWVISDPRFSMGWEVIS